MGKLAVYKYLSFMVLVITLLTAVFTLFAIFGGDANPTINTALAMLVYILPFLIVGDAVLLIFWLLKRRWHWAAIPAVALLCSINYIGTIYQPGLFNGHSDDVKSGIKIASYNVALFGRETSGFKAEDILSEMKNNQVDVFCMQEYNDVSGDKLNSDSYKEYFTYMATGRKDMVIYSRFPIRETQVIDFGQTNNSGMWADIDVNGRLLRVFNVHLETTGFNRTLHKVAKQEMNGVKVENNAILHAIFDNYTRGMVVRARQADLVAHAMEAAEIPVILCGDFNDVPYSFVYHLLLGDAMVDGFKECGSGFMYTFRGSKKARIDYIFHSKELKGETYYKQDMSYSDHFPVFMKIAL